MLQEDICSHCDPLAWDNRPRSFSITFVVVQALLLVGQVNKTCLEALPIVQTLNEPLISYCLAFQTWLKEKKKKNNNFQQHITESWADTPMKNKRQPNKAEQKPLSYC